MLAQCCHLCRGCEDVCVFMYRCVCVLAQCCHLCSVVTMCVCVQVRVLAQCGHRCRGCDDVCVCSCIGVCVGSVLSPV